MKNVKFAIIPLVIITLLALVFLLSSSSVSNKSNSDDNVFHITLASPNVYTNGTFTDVFTIKEGEYNFRFVPSGSSPQILSITLKGDTFDFSNNFELEGTIHQTGISEYFTWDYNGQKSFSITEMQNISIIINPNGNTLGSVSVDITRIE